ncbi:RpiB/LacA/LacB family sugar-phosphate isomerase [Phenylobacterium kunshanense]|uniref:Ribose-5-phosphate isomerase n=1 Tax=Phenylobacterium kunshanense TaxID=1445034 RepID=A0A328BGG2_9CAUL|nr:RpiB/LacA/LacB family sugar-phosphate isomerase [Phenylobacterium kunshanense]RAK66330.1 ribose-5-phosphate isomerase [Phenylobacterium kunshanense]
MSEAERPGRLTNKPICVGSDHRGFALKTRLADWLKTHGYEVTDCGADGGAERVDAMDHALRLVDEIRAGRSDFAIGICGSGQMMAMTANRFPFMRATLLHTPAESGPAREHGDANMLVLGADNTDGAVAEQILEAFLATPALGDRYAARRERLAKLDIQSR